MLQPHAIHYTVVHLGDSLDSLFCWAMRCGVILRLCKATGDANCKYGATNLYNINQIPLKYIMVLSLICSSIIRITLFCAAIHIEITSALMPQAYIIMPVYSNHRHINGAGM